MKYLIPKEPILRQWDAKEIIDKKLLGKFDSYKEELDGYYIGLFEKGDKTFLLVHDKIQNIYYLIEEPKRYDFSEIKPGNKIIVIVYNVNYDIYWKISYDENIHGNTDIPEKIKQDLETYGYIQKGQSELL